MERAGSQRHQLHPTRLEDSIVAQVVGVPEDALPDIGDPLDVGVRVHGPDGSRRETVVIEHPERAHAHLLGISVTVEGEMPAGLEPATILAVNLPVAPHL